MNHYKCWSNESICTIVEKSIHLSWNSHKLCWYRCDRCDRPYYVRSICTHYCVFFPFSAPVISIQTFTMHEQGHSLARPALSLVCGLSPPHETWSHLVLHIVKPRGLTWRRQEAQQVCKCACVGVLLRNYKYGTCRAPVSKGKSMTHNTDPLVGMKM